jgi:uracil-DNA glycosylase
LEANASERKNFDIDRIIFDRNRVNNVRSLIIYGMKDKQPQQIGLFNPDELDNNPKNQITFYNSIASLNSSCHSCQKCSLSSNRTQVVTGLGNRYADLLAIGEAPGEREDRTGQPFVGKSGQLLRKMLAAVGIDTKKDVYFTNLVRCHPSNNRLPTDREIKACQPYLIDEIQLVRPKVILAIGATCTKALIGKNQSITTLRGKWLDYQGIPCLPIFHPAYLLRNPTLEVGSPKWMTWMDLIEVKLRLDRL